MKAFFKNTWTILNHSIDDFVDKKITRMSAALAYYTVFSIAPMLIVVITLCDLFYGRSAIEGRIYTEIRSFVGEQPALQIQQLIKNATVSNDITWASVIGIIALTVAATSVFAEIQDSINFIWGIKAKPKKGWIKLLVNRLLSFSMLASLGFILLVSLLINVIMNALVADSVLARLFDSITKQFPVIALYAAYGINQLLTFLTISFIFGIIFKVLPDAKIKWKDVRMGAFTTAILFMLGKFVIGFYLGKTSVTSSYGAAGSVVIILLWVYYSAIILYFGAAFTKAYAQFTGSHIYPNTYAVWIRQVELENKGDLADKHGADKVVIPEEKVI
ncbi:YihY/virulence factor BrkB family protein [Foetidibacter luteolus]|uniref:YihY/virulence factor BrkB family protein n=1 Tax=Foetidibacter luteolus TaxID=2608880 RepID=UPI00129B1E99|nr:YihY/virulence factor BrkB family protein [Foetidibacter luteolus]